MNNPCMTCHAYIKPPGTECQCCGSPQVLELSPGGEFLAEALAAWMETGGTIEAFWDSAECARLTRAAAKADTFTNEHHTRRPK